MPWRSFESELKTSSCLYDFDLPKCFCIREADGADLVRDLSER